MIIESNVKNGKESILRLIELWRKIRKVATIAKSVIVSISRFSWCVKLHVLSHLVRNYLGNLNLSSHEGQTCRIRDIDSTT